MEMQVVTNRPQFVNKSLQKATNLIMAMGDQIRTKQFDIAAILADVEVKGLYKDDGFKNAAEYAMETFGMQKSLAYNLITIGTQYTRPILSDNGKVIGHASNLVPPANPEKQNAPITDFTTAQIGRLLPLGRDKVVELVESGEITPQTTFKTLESTVKALKPRKNKELPSASDEQSEDAPEQVSMDEVESEQPKALTLNTVRGESFDQLSTDILIAELRLRGYKVFRDGKEQLIDWKGGEQDAEK